MKKLLTILGAAGLVATTSATVVSCEKKDDNKEPTLKEFSLKNEKEALNIMQSIYDATNINGYGFAISVPEGITKTVDEKTDSSPLGMLFDKTMKELLVANGYKCPDNYRFSTNKSPSDDQLEAENLLWAKTASLFIYDGDEENGQRLEVKDVLLTFQRDLTQDDYNNFRKNEAGENLINLEDYKGQPKNIWLSDEQIASLEKDSSTIDKSIILQAWTGMFAWGHGEDKTETENVRAMKDFYSQNIEEKLTIEVLNLNYSEDETKLESAEMKISFSENVNSVTSGKASIIEKGEVTLNIVINQITTN